MLDIKFIRQQPDMVKKAVQDKNLNLDIDKLLDIDANRTALQQKLEELNRQRNENAKVLKQSQGKPDQTVIDEGRKLKEKIASIEAELKEVQTAFDTMMTSTPNIPSEDTPLGKDENDNVVIKAYNKKPVFDFEPKDHIALGKDLDLLDLERGVKVHGFRGYYLKNEAALMHMGLMMLGMEKMMKYGYVPMITPTLVKDSVLFGSGHFPSGKEEVFHIKSLEDKEKEDLFLAGTSEPSLLAYHANETLKKEDLPKKYCGFSPCYRSEVGSYGKDTKGLFRVHEFMKIEQVVICEADFQQAEKIQQEMMQMSHEILDDLGLHYQDLAICTGDMGTGKYKMFDIETWMPARGKFCETHSASSLTDWQARRLNLKYVDSDQKKQYAFTLNNTQIASPRILIAILEAYQNRDGSITVPEVLRKYVGKERIEKK